MQIPYGPFITQQQAASQGIKRYYIPMPCCRGHIAPRSTKTRNCCQCDLDRKRSSNPQPTKPDGLTPEQQRIQQRIDQLHLVNFSQLAREGFYVYAYLRSRDLTPYYIGIGSTRMRAYCSQHVIHVPPDRRLIRVLRRGLVDWATACHWETRYISHYGRIDLGTGILRNRTAGGEGVPGRVVSEATRQKISASWSATHSKVSAEKHRIPLDAYLKLSSTERGKAKSWMQRHPDASWSDYLKLRQAGAIRNGADRPTGLANNKMVRSSFKYVHRGLPAEAYQRMSRRERIAAITWLKADPTRHYDEYTYKPRA